MGRKDLTTERISLILDAVERCIGRYGLQAMTLEQIADEAGINRGLIHHYVGNREDILQLVFERLLERYRASFEVYASNLQHTDQVEALVDYYFNAWFELEPHDDALILALLSESERDPHVRQLLWSLYTSFAESICVELARLFPAAEKQRLEEVSYALMLMAFSHATLNWLRLPLSTRANIRATAVILIKTLTIRSLSPEEIHVHAS